ncbi:MAG: glycine--tRNA ligase subunit beta [Deltaproteobacteria bacterium]|nr:glycine--tRNA ligase subunit beta [Deltaproteobacteria bacterium]
MSTLDLVFEIGVEEIPAEFLPRAREDLRARFLKEMQAVGFGEAAARIFSTPRRLLLLASGIPARQPDRLRTVTGPHVSKAFDLHGRATPAMMGFAKGHGVALEAVKIIATPKGECIAVEKDEKGRAAQEILAEVLPKLVREVPFRKLMRWGDGDVKFARPIHWIVALLGGEVVPFKIGDIASGAESRGHRFLAPGPVGLAGRDVVAALADAKVLVDPEARQKKIRVDLARLATEACGEIHEDAELVATVADLTEWPIADRGSFEAAFLEVPAAVLVASMRAHQRCFPVYAKGGALLPHFLYVSNTEVRDPAVVRRGNERVLRARLNDARFFFQTDLKRPLDDCVASLGSITFLAQLGTVLEKVARVESLAALIAEIVAPSEVARCKRAAHLAKADLVTGMVGEFPELQGVMGREYALRQGVEPAVARAIADHYKPKGAGDPPAESDVGAIVAIADKLDTLVGCFGVGLVPTGAADPYALRRSAIGILATILARRYTTPLSSLVEMALARLGPKLPAGDHKATIRSVIDFFGGRLKSQWADEHPTDLVDAILAPGFDDVVDAHARLNAIAELRAGGDFAAIAVTFKRVANITKDAPAGEPDLARLTEPAERALVDALSHVRGSVTTAARNHAYAEAFGYVRALKPHVDKLFDDVLVMCDDAALRDARLRLVRSVADLFRGLADFSRLQTEK